MKTLVIYDEVGKIFNMMTGSYTKPQGIRYLEVSIPEGKQLVGVDVESNEAILEDIPQSATDSIRTELAMIQDAINFLIMKEMF